MFVELDQGCKYWGVQGMPENTPKFGICIRKENR